MESTPRPGYYPDPSVPGYIRYWDGSKWVPGTSKPMPKKAGGAGDAEVVVESGAVPPPPRAAAAASAAGAAAASAASGGDTPGRASIGQLTFDDLLPPPDDATQDSSYQDDLDPVAAPLSKAPAFAPPRPLSEVSFDDAKPSESSPFGHRPPADFPGAAPEPKPPVFTPPRSLADTSFDSPLPEAPRQGQAPQVASAAGMGISIAGAPGMPVAPRQTPAQLSAANQALRIRLLRPDGKPFDGPEITTGPKQADSPQGSSRTEFDTPRGPKKQAPKVVVKTGPLERVGHTLAVLLISAIGILPLGYLLMKSVHDREDKLAAKITVPTKMNVLDTTSEAYLGGMVVVLLVVTVLYVTRLKRRRAR
ncbi:DUF2510 domain-containing protein [Catenulispora rubra]|uniref:DUF2510 domain-containing protein n=1 Tax=Catenulispora rubra TaxID=280293 RepID=UPI001892053C|nr:DUF2510 domain-containing protein [Catenulispora rubra]